MAVEQVPELSVLVLTRNRASTLRTCVSSILSQQFTAFELLILDDASESANTAQVIAGEFADARIRPYRVETQLGVAGGRNFLMEQARGRVLVVIDDDAVFVRDDALAKVASSFTADATMGATAFHVTNIVNARRTPTLPFSKAHLARDRGIASRRTGVSSFRGCGHAIRKSLVDEIGGYRHDMFFGEEELDLAYRIIQSGQRIVYEPSIEVEHYPMPSQVVGGGKNSQELYYHVRNRAYLAYRYLPWKYAISYYAIWMIRYALRSLRGDGLLQLIRGALATPQFLRGVEREVLDQRALAYLTRNGGRLWF